MNVSDMSRDQLVTFVTDHTASTPSPVRRRSVDGRFIDLQADTEALRSFAEALPVCEAVHPFVLHTDEAEVVCTLPAGHPGGEHEDHSHTVVTGEVMLWTVGDNVHRGQLRHPFGTA